MSAHVCPDVPLPDEGVSTADESVEDLRRQRNELLLRLEALDQKNLMLEKEVGQRGVKLSCANVALARAQIAFDEISQQREDCNVSRLVLETTNGLRPLAEERGIVLQVEAAAVDGQVDATKLRHIVENLVGNAIKFTAAGGSIWVSLQRDADALVLRVQDSGIGMSEETRKNLFRRYYWATETEGSGLGLLIVKNMVRLHRGSLDIQSEQGKGSLFTVTLPQDCGRDAPLGGCRVTSRDPHTVLLFDQRGVRRPRRFSCDIDAVERWSFGPVSGHPGGHHGGHHGPPCAHR